MNFAFGLPQRRMPYGVFLHPGPARSGETQPFLPRYIHDPRVERTTSMDAETSICTVRACATADAQMTNLHDTSARTEIVRRIARLCGGEVASAEGTPRPGQFLVPDDTMLMSAAAALGIRQENQLYGGVVPERFVATKIISHGLPFADARAPAGWAHDLAANLGDAVLRGFSVFAQADAQAAGRLLLEHGPIRLKDVQATSGRGQTVVRDIAQLDEAILALETHELRTSGLVIEENLEDVRTYSVGLVRLFGHSVAYWGTQALTVSNFGEEVYGGSQLHCVRGGWDELLAMDLDPELAEVVDKARRYDAAVFAAYPAMFASRRNYDVAAGRDRHGRPRLGVLEQSWRVGGASGAEIAAFEAFAADPSLVQVNAATVEIYGEADAAPAGAAVYFSGMDPVVGPLTKYAAVQ